MKELQGEQVPVAIERSGRNGHDAKTSDGGEPTSTAAAAKKELQEQEHANGKDVYP